MIKRDPKKEFDYDKKFHELQSSSQVRDKKYKAALRQIKAMEREREFAKNLRGTVKIHRIAPKSKSLAKNEATCVWVASDWHVEEVVIPNTIGNLNEYNMDIAQQRAEQFFVSGLKLTNLLARDVDISTIVIALLGDFFSGHIHEELKDITATEPVKAAIYAQNLIASGIQYVLDNSEYNLVIPCHVGNHSRTTKQTHFASENGHSLEYFMYKYLEDHFKGNRRVKFLIATGQHSYIDVYDMRLRFMHGHSTKYHGGVGGITIPINKAIAQWDTAIKADLTVLGHYHQFFDGGKFICNGSMIGYNAYALSIKASYEPPKQALFLIDKKRKKTCVWPILFDT